MKDRAYRWIVRLGSLFLRLLDVRIEVRGSEHVPAEGAVVLAISHFSYLDFILAEWAIWRGPKRYTRFMATAASFEHKLAGPLMRSMGHIPVDRSAGASAYRFAARALDDGQIVGVFPETRVSRSFTLLAFKNGAVRMAARSGAPLIPCVIWGSHRLMTRTHKTQLRKSRHTPVIISFGPPLYVGSDEDPTCATERLRAAMEGLLAQAQDSYPVEGSGAWWQPAHRGGGAPTAEDGLLLDGPYLAAKSSTSRAS